MPLGFILYRYYESERKFGRGIWRGCCLLCCCLGRCRCVRSCSSSVSICTFEPVRSTFVQVKQETTFCCCRSLCSRFCLLFLCCGRVPSRRRESVVPGYPSVVRPCLVLQMSPVPLGLKARRTRSSSNSPPCRPPLSSCVCVCMCVCVCVIVCVCERENDR